VFNSRRSTSQYRVSYGDTDKAQVVHHAAYFRFLEMGRVEFWREGGLDYRRFEETTGLGLPVVEAKVRYRVAARFDDLIEVETSVDRVSRASVWYAGTIRRHDGILLLESQIRLACVSLAEGQLRKVPDSVLDASLLPGYEV
jgi:acyl-CoA thioester hydrolase